MGYACDAKLTASSDEYLTFEQQACERSDEILGGSEKQQRVAQWILAERQLVQAYTRVSNDVRDNRLSKLDYDGLTSDTIQTRAEQRSFAARNVPAAASRQHEVRLRIFTQFTQRASQLLTSSCRIHSR
jgi:hypothetical protein